MTIDPNIIKGIKNGSYKDFELFYKLFNAKLYHFVMKLSNGDQYMAQEIVQATFIKLWETREMLDVDKNIITYVCTIARNNLLNQYKRQTLTWAYESFILANKSDCDQSTEQVLGLNFLEGYIEKIVDKLPPACKQVFTLSRQEGLSNKEIAQQLQISEKTVEGQITKALSMLRKHLQPYLKMFIICLSYIRDVVS